MIVTARAVGPAVDVVRRYQSVDHLYETCGSVDFSSNSGLFCGCNRYELFLTFSVLVVSFELGVSSCKCKGTREYARKLPPLPLARETAGVRECGAT